MINFKIHYAIPLEDDTVVDDNVDFKIILQNGRVYYGFATTPENLRSLLERNPGNYFWDADLIVLPDLRKETVRDAVAECIADGYFEKMFSDIGNINTVFGNETITFEEIEDSTYSTQ